MYVALLSTDYHVPFANRFFRERFGESTAAAVSSPVPAHGALRELRNVQGALDPRAGPLGVDRPGWPRLRHLRLPLRRHRRLDPDPRDGHRHHRAQEGAACGGGERGPLPFVRHRLHPVESGPPMPKGWWWTTCPPGGPSPGRASSKSKAGAGPTPCTRTTANAPPRSGRRPWRRVRSTPSNTACDGMTASTAGCRSAACPCWRGTRSANGSGPVRTSPSRRTRRRKRGG